MGMGMGMGTFEMEAPKGGASVLDPQGDGLSEMMVSAFVRKFCQLGIQVTMMAGLHMMLAPCMY